MLTILKPLGGLAFLKRIIQLWYDEVVEERDIRHYFININPDGIMRDQINFYDFVMRQPDRAYREPPFQSAPLDVQVGGGVFDEVVIVLRNLLLQEGLHRDLVPRVSTHIIEIVEESRAQAEDIVITTWKPVDVTPENVLRFYNKQRGDARLEANNDIYATRGYAYPFWTRIDPVSKLIWFIASADAQEWSNLDEVKKLTAQAKEKVPMIEFEAVDQKPAPLFRSMYSLPFHHGVPTRLFLRAAKQFASHFDAGMAIDKKREILRSVLTI